jgi:hypothetical protein
MRFYLALTDYDWYRFQAGRSHIHDVNFRQPSGGVEFQALQPGASFAHWRKTYDRDCLVEGPHAESRPPACALVARMCAGTGSGTGGPDGYDPTWRGCRVCWARAGRPRLSAS